MGLSPIQGYKYIVVEWAPSSGPMGVWVREAYRYVADFDNLPAAEEVLAALEKHNVDFASWGIILHPVWRNDGEKNGYGAKPPWDVSKWYKNRETEL